jgi:hypothetical protein
MSPQSDLDTNLALLPGHVGKGLGRGNNGE